MLDAWTHEHRFSQNHGFPLVKPWFLRCRGVGRRLCWDDFWMIFRHRTRGRPKASAELHFGIQKSSDTHRPELKPDHRAPECPPEAPRGPSGHPFWERWKGFLGCFLTAEAESMIFRKSWFYYGGGMTFKVSEGWKISNFNVPKRRCLIFLGISPRDDQKTDFARTRRVGPSSRIDTLAARDDKKQILPDPGGSDHH